MSLNPLNEIQFSHWPHARRPVEKEIIAFFFVRGLRPMRWSNPPGGTSPIHAHPYRKTVYCLQGSISYSLPDLQREVELLPGDRLTLPPGTRHTTLVGSEGVTCFEAGE